MPDDHLYEISSTATGGRAGHVSSADPELELDLALPESMGGDGQASGTNPEQLFSAGWSACFQQAVLAIGRSRDIDVDGCEVSVTVGLVGEMKKGLDLTARIDVDLPNADPSEAQKIVDIAHKGCPYSRATRGNIDVELNVANTASA
ncbi:organic hydroperoxide resistance protein [Thermoleophilia bacterium SCSIO 60948]|nr:organic hydroperoxide resistance protein [Thermoleophilia bacterium SCSIO 60948]